MAESSGGASWFTEYNVLAGLSSRSFGRFSYFVTRIAAGRVERGLPMALRRCGYSTTFALSGPWRVHERAQLPHHDRHPAFLDARDLGAKGIEPDRFFYDKATALFRRKRRRRPQFIFVYLAANHFPWENQFPPRADAVLVRAGQRAEGR